MRAALQKVPTTMTHLVKVLDYFKVNWFNVHSYVHIHGSSFNWISTDVQHIPIPIAIPNP